MVELKAHSRDMQQQSTQQSIESCDFGLSQSLNTDGGSKRLVRYGDALWH